MYLKILLIFSGVVCISAQSTSLLCHSYGCFDSSDTQVTLTLNGDEIYYANFKKGLLIWHSPIPIILRVPLAYQYALYYRSACRNDLSRWKPDKSVAAKTKEAPEILIYSKDEVVPDEENTLVCFVDRFYPPSINIKWTKNNEEVSVDDSFSRCLPRSDGTFYVISRLDFVPKEGDIYGCTVEHSSLEKPQTKFWEVEVEEVSSGPSVFCGLGLTLGLLGVAVGTFFFVKGNQYKHILEA